MSERLLRRFVAGVLTEAYRSSTIKTAMAQSKLDAAIKKFAQNWTHFADEMPDTSPEDMAPDAAEGFFYDYPDWEKWARATGQTRAEIKSNVADWVHNAMTKGR